MATTYATSWNVNALRSRGDSMRSRMDKSHLIWRCVMGTGFERREAALHGAADPASDAIDLRTADLRRQTRRLQSIECRLRECHRQCCESDDAARRVRRLQRERVLGRRFEIGASEDDDIRTVRARRAVRAA